MVVIYPVFTLTGYIARTLAATSPGAVYDPTLSANSVMGFASFGGSFVSSCARCSLGASRFTEPKLFR